MFNSNIGEFRYLVHGGLAAAAAAAAAAITGLLPPGGTSLTAWK